MFKLIIIWLLILSNPIPSTWGILKWTPKSKKEEKTVLDLGLTLKPQHMITNIVQGVFWQSTSTGLFWDFWGSLRLLCNPKTGRKLLLRQKYSLIRKSGQEAVCQKEEFQVVVFWGWNSELLTIHFFFIYWILNIIDFKTWLSYSPPL